MNRLQKKLAGEEQKVKILEENLNKKKSLDELREREAELKRHIEEDQAVIDNEETLPSDKEAAQARIAERNKELERLAPQVAEREKAKPLREKIKEIFKKYKWPVALVLAVGTTIGSIVGPLLSSLKATGKNVGDGMTNLGKQILPALLGAIVKYVFSAVGNAVSFHGKQAWLLILAVAALLLEKTIKRKD